MQPARLPRPSASRRGPVRTGPNPTPTLLRLSVILSGLAGFALGLVLLVSIALGQTSAIPFAALVQAHGQVQVLGFVGRFVFGTAAQLLPGFLATPLPRRRELVVGGFLAAAGLTARRRPAAAFRTRARRSPRLLGDR